MLRPGRLDKLGQFSSIALVLPQMIDGHLISFDLNMDESDWPPLTRALLTVYVDLPNAQARLEILQKHARRLGLDADVDLAALAQDKRYHCITCG